MFSPVQNDSRDTPCIDNDGDSTFAGHKSRQRQQQRQQKKQKQQQQRPQSARQPVTEASSASHRARGNGRRVSQSAGCASVLLPPQEADPVGDDVDFLAPLPGWPPSHQFLMTLDTMSETPQNSKRSTPSWQRGPLLLSSDVGGAEGEGGGPPGLITCRRGVSKSGLAGSLEGDDKAQPVSCRTDVISDFSPLAWATGASGGGVAAIGGSGQEHGEEGGGLKIVSSSTAGWAGWSKFNLADTAGDSCDDDEASVPAKSILSGTYEAMRSL